MENTDTRHKIGDRVVVLHNIILGNLIGTIKAIHERPTEPVYEVELDSLDMDLLYGFQLQTLASESEGIADETADETSGRSALNSEL